MGGFYLGLQPRRGTHLGPGMPRFLLHTIPRALLSAQLIVLSILKPFSEPPGQDRTPKAVPQGSPGSAVPVWDDVPLLGENRADDLGPHLGHLWKMDLKREIEKADFKNF